VPPGRESTAAGTLHETRSQHPDDMADPLFPAQIACWPWAEVAVVLCAAAWGGILGSFINVVVYRVPRGESLVAAGSRCPACGTPIRPGDNIPVIGWLRLRGRCRSCGLSISAHYPLVEASCGILVAGLAAAELIGGGRWLPGFGDAFPAGIDKLLRGDWRLLLAFILHAAVILMLITWSLLDRAGWQPPDRQLVIPLAVSIGLAAAVPALAPPPPLPASLEPTGWWPRADAGWLAAAIGAAAGWLLGRLFSAGGVRLGLPLVGSVLGWQAVTVVAVVAAIAIRAGRWFGQQPRSMQLFLPAVATAWIAFWREWLALGSVLAAWLTAG